MIKENSEEPQKPRDNGDCAKYSFKQCGQYDGKPPSIPNCGKNDAPLPEDHQCSANTGGKICDADALSWPDKKPEEPECNIKVTLCDGQAPGCPEQKPNCPSDDKEDYEHYIHYKEKNFTEGTDVQIHTLKNHFGNNEKLKQAFQKAMTYKLVNGNYEDGINNRDSIRKDIIKDVLSRVGIALDNIDQEGQYNGLKDKIASKIGDTIIIDWTG